MLNKVLYRDNPNDAKMSLDGTGSALHKIVQIRFYVQRLIHMNHKMDKLPDCTTISRRFFVSTQHYLQVVSYPHPKLSHGVNGHLDGSGRRINCPSRVRGQTPQFVGGKTA